MIEGIEPFYQRIADGMTSALPDMWRHAWMDAIFYDGSVSYYGSYLVGEEEFCTDFETSRDAQKAFREMRALWATAGKMPWCRARFNLYSTGKFDLELSYDDSDENGFARFDEGADLEHHRQRLTRMRLPLQGAVRQVTAGRREVRCPEPARQLIVVVSGGGYAKLARQAADRSRHPNLTRRRGHLRVSSSSCTETGGAEPTT
jgi:hypothetical protein